MFKRRTVFTLLFLCLVLFINSIFLSDFTNWKRNSTLASIDESLFLPGGRMLKAVSLGYHESLADLYWIKTLIYFGEHTHYDTRFTYLENLIHLVTDLDPLFYYAYYWGSSAFLYDSTRITEEDQRKSTRLLEKAYQHIKNDYRIPYFLSFNYAMEHHDYEKSATIANEILNFPDAPLRVRNWVSHVNYRAGKKEQVSDVTSRVMMEEYLKMTEDKTVAGILRRRLAEFYESHQINQRIEILKNFANFYKKNEFSFLPITLFILLEGGNAAPESDLSFSRQFPLLNELIDQEAWKSSTFLQVEHELNRQFTHGR